MCFPVVLLNKDRQIPLCFGRKTRRSLNVKFESVVLGARKSGAAVVKRGCSTRLFGKLALYW